MEDVITQGKPASKYFLEDTQVEDVEYTNDQTVDNLGRPAIRQRTGTLKSSVYILVNAGFATLAFYGVGVNLVLYLIRVLHEGTAAAANHVSNWAGTVYITSLIGAFLGDGYWGRYWTCIIFQIIFLLGLTFLALSTVVSSLRPLKCDGEIEMCKPASTGQRIFFYFSIYLIALGSGGYQSNISSLGADQFDDEHIREKVQKISFFSLFYVSLQLGTLFSNTVLVYIENIGYWTPGFWASAAAGGLALCIFLLGTPIYRHRKPGGNPIFRVAQVLVAAFRKWNLQVPSDGNLLYEVSKKGSAIKGSRKILHTDDFRFLDKAAIQTERDNLKSTQSNPWWLCTVTQVEEVKCLWRILPIWASTIIFSTIYTQMSTLFVEQAAAMNTHLGSFNIPPASVSSFDIITVSLLTVVYRWTVVPLTRYFTGNARGISALQRMGVGLVLGCLAMVVAGSVERKRLIIAKEHGLLNEKNAVVPMSVFWQVPQHVLVGASEVFMYIGQLEFFYEQAPDAIRSLGISFYLTSMAFGNYLSTVLVIMVTRITTSGGRMGWIPDNLNLGHLDYFFWMLAIMAAIDFVVYVLCARSYKNIRVYSEVEAAAA